MTQILHVPKIILVVRKASKFFAGFMAIAKVVCWKTRLFICADKHPGLPIESFAK
jgi:hypothetical protein